MDGKRAFVDAMEEPHRSGIGLPDAGLMRINRSALVRPEAITGVWPLWGGRAMARLGSDMELEVSRSSTPALKERFGIKGDFYRKEED